MKRLLFIAHRVPYPPDKGERVRAFHEIQVLSRHFRVSLAALAFNEADLDGAAKMRQWCESVMVAPTTHWRSLGRGAVSLASGGSVTGGYFASTKLSRQVASQGPYDVAIGYSSGVLPLLLKAPASARIMDLVDIDSAKWDSYSRKACFPKNILFAREAMHVRKLEQQAARRCDAVVLVSEAEKQMLQVGSGDIHVISNGVDLEYFKPEAVTQPETMAGGESSSPSLVFTGQMDYQPNVEGVCWFAREVWPGLRRRIPQLRFIIVGRQPAPAVRKLADMPGITVTGAVDDVRQFLANAAIAIAPLQIARGVQNKVLEAMAMGKSVVASGGAIEGIDAQVGRDVLRADSAQQWQQEILQLLTDDALRRDIGQAARACMEKNYSWASQLAPLVKMCQEFAAQPAVAHPGKASSEPMHSGPPVFHLPCSPTAQARRGEATR